MLNIPGTYQKPSERSPVGAPSAAAIFNTTALVPNVSAKAEKTSTLRTYNLNTRSTHRGVAALIHQQTRTVSTFVQVNAITPLYTMEGLDMELTYNGADQLDICRQETADTGAKPRRSLRFHLSHLMASQRYVSGKVQNMYETERDVYY